VPPDWLTVGTTLVDPDGLEWFVREVSGGRTTVQHPEQGAHEVRTRDLVDWVESGDWERVA
jgi:hypothetical protein